MLRRRSPGQAIWALFEPLAERHGVDFGVATVVMAQGGNVAALGAASVAFALVRPGASVVLNLAELNGYPGVDRKTSKRGHGG